MKLKILRVNNIEHPLGFQIMPLSFSWTVEEAGEAKEQQSARIRIYENVETEADMEGKKAVYDSGEVTDADSLGLLGKCRIETENTVSMVGRSDRGYKGAGICRKLVRNGKDRRGMGRTVDRAGTTNFIRDFAKIICL